MVNLTEVEFPPSTLSWGKITYVVMYNTKKTSSYGLIKWLHLEKWFDLYESEIIYFGKTGD